jgi:ABC-2 type transport system permease protein
MRKILVIANRDYRASVRSKGFIVTLVLMPVLMSASIGMQALFQKLEDTKEKKFAVIDRTGRKLADFLEEQATIYNELMVFDPKTKKQTASTIKLEIVPPSANTPEAILQQRFEQSQRVDRDEIEGIVEIGPEAMNLKETLNPVSVDDAASIRFQAKKPAQRQFMAWAEKMLNIGIQIKRFQGRLTPEEIKSLNIQVPLKYKALTKQAPDGTYQDAATGQQIANFVLPGILIGLMFMIVMVGATPAMQGIVEEKSQRIAEVLLGSVSPFELMAGKLLGVIGVSMTMAIVYVGGGFLIANHFDVAGGLTPVLLIWFILFMVLALLIFGSLFIAVGAASGDIKDTQTLLMPIMILVCLPFFALGPIMQDPNGKIAVICSFFPFATPMLLVARQSVPPGVPVWQLVTGILLVLATTIFCVWAAGRIFRIGILMQGKGAKMSDLVRWVVKG